MISLIEIPHLLTLMIQIWKNFSDSVIHFSKLFYHKGSYFTTKFTIESYFLAPHSPFLPKQFPSRNFVTIFPFSYTLILSTVRSIKSISSSLIGRASFVTSIKSIARNLSSKSSPCIFLSHSGINISLHSNSLFHAIR